MKRCPQCGRDYNDDSLSFCLDDGADLLFGPGRDDAATAMFAVPPTDDLPTRVLPTVAEPHETIGDAAEKQGFPAQRTAKPKKFDKRLLLAPILLAVIVLAGFAGYRYYSPRTTEKLDSIAVLPFENRSGSSDADYLSDGLTDSLIFRFAQLPNLKVSPTSSVMRYKDATDIAQVARDLDVDAVLTGKLRLHGDNLTINVQLIDGRTNKIIWVEQYDRTMADLLATQREIATTLTQKMQLKLAGNEQGLTKKYTGSNDAYQLYMKGRYHWSRRTRDDLLKAVDNYKQAIALDSNFALAYAATAEVYNSMGKNPDVPPKDCIPLAKAAATRALEIDPGLAQAHSALADSLALYDWDWAESERHFKKALELDPNISYTYVAYGGSYLGPVGKTNEAVAQLERAVALEPSAMINNCILTTTYIYARQYDKAVAQGRSTYDLDPTFPFAPHWFGFALIASGKYDDAISLGQKVSPDSPFGWMAAVVIGQAYAEQGKRTEAEQQISRLRELGKTRYIRPYYLASIYTALGEKDKAFAELERSYVERDCYLGRISVDPFLDPLRDDPRFKDLMRRMKLSN
ncbi:MAG TPA: hypothetical protein VJV05_08120 [Pyrinomonadaceae bacterium]|nr:hypothetical protein [Pyrinomonadaceae bacterium]